MWFLEDKLLTLDIEDGIDVGPGGYRQLANFVELIPGVELGDPADGTGWLFRVDHERRLSDNAEMQENMWARLRE